MDVFRFRHELERGRTSAIAYEVLGFDAKVWFPKSITLL